MMYAWVCVQWSMAILGGGTSHNDAVGYLSGSELCTASVISPHALLTAAHCSDANVFTLNDVSYTITGAHTSTVDVAVLDVADILPVTPLQISAEKTQAGATVTLVGYGSGEQRSANVVITAITTSELTIDGDNNAVGQMLAALLDWPQATFASAVEVSGQKAKVTREVDGGLQTLEIDLPGIITADLRLNEPRYASLPNIMKAKTKPLDVKEAASLGVDVAPRLKVVKVTEPPKRSGGIKVETAADLVTNLKTAGVL